MCWSVRIIRREVYYGKNFKVTEGNGCPILDLQIRNVSVGKCWTGMGEVLVGVGDGEWGSWVRSFCRYQRLHPLRPIGFPTFSFMIQ